MAYEYEYRNSTYLLPRAAQSLKRTTSVVWAWRSSLYVLSYGMALPPLTFRCAARSFTRRPPGDTRPKGSARL
jgi:hypothetical protein